MDDTPAVRLPTGLEFLVGGGHTGDLVRRRDWRSSALGAPEGWSPTLRSALSLMLGSGFPMFLAWGPELTLLYNDAYAEMLGAKHPDALGGRFHEVWAEIWPDILPLVEGALRGEAIYQEELPLTVHRRGFDEPAWFTFSYSPLRSESGVVEGLFCAVVDVSETHRSREALAKGRAELEELTDALPVLVSFVDREGRYRFVNRLYETWFARNRADIQGQLLRDVVGEAAYAGVAERIARVLAGERLSFEQFMPYKDGGQRHVQVEYVPRFEADGGVAGFYALVQDVTQARKAEADFRRAVVEARAAAERVALALNAGAIVGTWVWDVANDHFLADVQFARSFGLDADLCLAGLPLDQVMKSIHPDDMERVSETIAEALGRGGAYRCEYRVLRADGVWRWIEASGKVELDAAGAAVRFPGVLIDVDDRRKTEDALMRANNLLRTFMLAVPGVIYAKDRQGRLLIGNRGTEALLGRSQEEFVGRTDRELLNDPAEAEAVMANDRRIMDRGVIEHLEERVTYADGTEAWWHSTKAPLRDDDGTVVGLVGASVDITERRRAEEHRQLLVNELNHRVKNTLAVVQGLARQTFRHSTDIDRAVQSFEERLSALSRAHNVLTDTSWSAADLRDIVDGQTGRVDGRVRADGPPAPLPPQLAVSLALALHELNTNATKYGALANDTGEVVITWSIEAASRRLRVTWQEQGGPEVIPPQRRGFGSRMIERALSQEAAGKVEVDYAPSGLVCRIEVNLPESPPVGALT